MRQPLARAYAFIAILILLLSCRAYFLPALALSKPAPNAPIEDKWAVVIGISDFADPGVPHLKYAAKDARDFYNYLTDAQGGKFRSDHVKLLLDSDATKVNIMDALGDSFLPHAANPKDLVVIYLSTHGSPAGADIRGVNYVVAYDTQVRKLFATGIEMKQLMRMIKERVHTNRILLVLDTCYSGAGAQLTQGHKGISRTNVDSSSVAQGVGALVISSSSPDQKAWESDDLRNSYFTRYLINSLKENDNADIEKAFNRMRNHVQESVLKDKGEVQTPVIAGTFSGPTLNISAPPTVSREAPVTAPIDEKNQPKAKGNGSRSLAGAPDFSAYVEHVRMGNKLVEENKTWDAIHEFEQATRANPGTIEAYIVLGQLYGEQDRIKEMYTAAQRAVVNDEESSRAREVLALATLRSGNVEEAMRQAQKAVSLDPFNSMAHNLLGYISEHKFNRVDQAEQEYRKALELNNLNTRALVNLGLLVEKHRGNQEEAESLFRKAIESDGDDWEAHLSLGHLLFNERGKAQEAEKEIRKASELAPANARIHSELGNVLAADKQRLEESETELKKGIELGSDSGSPHYLLANFLLNKRGRFDEAEKEYRKALEMDGQLDEAMIALADLLVSHRHVYDESDALYKKALKVNPKNPEAHLGLANIQVLLFKNYTGAESEIRAALAINPKNSLAYDRLGDVLGEMGKYGDAKLAYQSAIHADPDNADAHYHLGEVLAAKFNERQAAKEEFSKAISLNGSCSNYVTALANLVSLDPKGYIEAQKLYKQAISLNFADSEAHLKLGLLLIEKCGERKAGEAELKTAREQKPDDKQIKAAYERFVR